MRDQQLQANELPDYKSRKNKTNNYGFDPHEQAIATYTGMGAEHQRARPVGGEIDGADTKDRHQGTSRHLRQGDGAVSPAAAAGDRESSGRPQADAVARRSPCPQHRGPRHHGRHRADARLVSLKVEVDVKRRSRGQWAAPVPQEIARARCGALKAVYGMLYRRHCERSEAIQLAAAKLDCFVAALLAMTSMKE